MLASDSPSTEQKTYITPSPVTADGLAPKAPVKKVCTWHLFLPLSSTEGNFSLMCNAAGLWRYFAYVLSRLVLEGVIQHVSLWHLIHQVSIVFTPSHLKVLAIRRTHQMHQVYDVVHDYLHCQQIVALVEILIQTIRYHIFLLSRTISDRFLKGSLSLLNS